jgi:hypothetical protein
VDCRYNIASAAQGEAMTRKAKAKNKAKAKQQTDDDEKFVAAAAARQKAARKIRKLAKMTVANGCTPEQAASAVRLAKALMEKFGVTEEDIRDENGIGGREVGEAKKPKPQPPPSTATFDDFYYFAKGNEYFYTPTRELWPSTTIAKLFNEAATVYLARTKRIDTMTWCPGEPMVVRDKFVLKSGWKSKKDSHSFNLYVPSEKITGDPEKAGPWRELGKKMFGEHLERIESWLAYKVQNPGKKINHALVLGSPKQGIGKDTYLKSVVAAIGPWNFTNIGAAQTTDPDHNGFLENVICCIGEVHDIGEKRKKYYDLSKDWCAAPPMTLTVADKWVKAHPCFNVVGIIFTTNHKTDGLYLVAEDRRHYVVWIELLPEDFEPDYWNTYNAWLEGGGDQHVAAYLATRDLSKFDPYAAPPKTDAFWAIVNASQAPEDSELADVFDRLGIDPVEVPIKIVWPPAVTRDMLIRCAMQIGGEDGSELAAWLGDRRNRHAIPKRLDAMGYSVTRSTWSKDGWWVIDGKRQAIYTRATLKGPARLKAAQAVVRSEVARIERLAARAKAAKQGAKAAVRAEGAATKH